MGGEGKQAECVCVCNSETKYNLCGFVITHFLILHHVKQIQCIWIWSADG